MHGRCWCDGGPTTNPSAAALPLYRGERCLQLLHCRYWSEGEQACADPNPQSQPHPNPNPNSTPTPTRTRTRTPTPTPHQAWSTSGLRTDNGTAAGIAAMADGFLRYESDHPTLPLPPPLPLPLPLPLPPCP